MMHEPWCSANIYLSLGLVTWDNNQISVVYLLLFPQQAKFRQSNIHCALWEISEEVETGCSFVIYGLGYRVINSRISQLWSVLHFPVYICLHTSFWLFTYHKQEIIFSLDENSIHVNFYRFPFLSCNLWLKE